MPDIKLPQFPMGVQVSGEDMIPAAQNGTSGLIKVKDVRNIGSTIAEGGTEKTASNENLKSVNQKVETLSQSVDNSFQTVNQNFTNVGNEIQSANTAIGTTNKNIGNHELDKDLHVTKEKQEKWDGYSTQLSENTQDIANLNTAIQGININPISKKTAFIEQFITSFYSRGQIASEKTTENTVTETSITVPRSAGYGGLDIANTSNFKEGSVIVIKYDDGTYATHFITSVVNSTSLTILPTLSKDTTINTKIERAWLNSAHGGKFYMRYLAQKLANATEIVNGYGENVFYTNFDGSSNDDVGAVIGTALIGYNDSINKSVNYGSIVERGIGKTAYVDTSTVGSGIEFPSFYAKCGERLILKLFLMNRTSANTTKIAIKSSSGEISSFNISGSNSQIMKPYYLEFDAPYKDDLLWIEITNQTTGQNIISVSEVKVMRNLEINNYILPRKGKILALGDSWITGDLVSTAEREPLTTHLAELLPNSTIINKGVGGNTVIDLLNRFDADVSPFTPDVVVINIGMNDAYNPSSADFTIATNIFVGKLKELVQKCINIGAKPVVIGVPALCEQDGSFTSFALNDRARLYNKKLYREIYNDNHGNPTIKNITDNLENNGVYISGNNYKDSNITIKDTNITISKVKIQAQAFDSTTSANVVLKIYDSTRSIVLATSTNTVAITVGATLQTIQFNFAGITLLANTAYILAFEGTNLWTVNEGDGKATKEYKNYTINSIKIGNETPPTVVANKWFSVLLTLSLQKFYNIPTGYTTQPSLDTINSDTVISIFSDNKKLLLSAYTQVGQEFSYEE